MIPYRALRSLSGLITLAIFSGSTRGADAVKLEQLDNRVSVTIGGKPFTDYYFAAEGGRDYVRPFMYPVRAADGTIVTSDQKALFDADQSATKGKSTIEH